jgi:hypothetical protein
LLFDIIRREKEVTRRLLLGCALAAALLVPLSANAQNPRSKITFVMPQSVDPVKLTIISEGFAYTNSDGGSPGDNEGPLIVGNLFLPPGDEGAGGLEVHGAIPDPVEGFDEIKEVVLRTSYLGGEFEVLSETAPDFPSFTPWAVVNASTPDERIFRFLKQPGSGTLNAGVFFGMFQATTEDPLFAGARFTVTGYREIQGTVPEPGTVALLVSAATGAALLRLRRRQK